MLKENFSCLQTFKLCKITDLNRQGNKLRRKAAEKPAISSEKMALVPKPSFVQQPKRVDIKEVEAFTEKDSSTRPDYEKMTSCDLSIEESSGSFENEEICSWTNASSLSAILDGKNINEGKMFLPKTKLSVDLEIPTGKCVESTDEQQWKLGALDRAKTRSPTENDERRLEEILKASLLISTNDGTTLFDGNLKG